MKISDYHEMYPKELEEKLSLLHTKQLLNLRERSFVRRAIPIDAGLTEEIARNYLYNIEQDKLGKVLKKILSAREHVPNKQEAKEIRQKKAKSRA